jgi:hypothetical protein
LSHKRSKSNEEAKKKEIRSRSQVPRTIDNTSISIGLNSYRSNNVTLAGEGQYCVFTPNQNDSKVLITTETPVSGEYINENIFDVSDLSKLK